MNRRATWVLGFILGGIFLCLLGFLFVFAAAVKSDDKGFGSGDKLGVVEILGPITDSKRTLKDLREYEEAENIKALLVRIDSPGGAVGPSQEIYDALMRIREKKKVIVSMGSTAASGGFYIASAGDKVFANPGTLTGSIGVIFQLPNISGVMDWAHVKMNTITAGKMKDSGSPFRDMSPEEHKYFEGVLEDVHQQFIAAVAKGRNLKVEDVQPYADGRVFTGRQAKQWKLVDELGGFDVAVAEAGKMAGIKGQPKLEYPHREKKLLRELMGGDDEAESFFTGAATGVLKQLAGGLQYRLPMWDVGAAP
ncbi:MAG TPA: signal peptide peptidase SppA [Myxococcaceae bacterium]|nr:signal peptide peptidase SppA [Myxococcaceae bacterium]